MLKTQDNSSLRWALPEGLKVPPDQLVYRLDIFGESILLHRFQDGETTTRPVSAVDVARAFSSELRLASGVLPEGALWWGMGPEGAEVALWRPPRVWKVALVLEAFKPPRRFELPMPGLIFVCSLGRPPRVYAAKKRPASPGTPLCHAPLYNVFQDGRTCAGTHKYPNRVEEAPESFMVSFFTRDAHHRGRSRKYPEDLLALWEELDGKRSYPIRDLVPCGIVQDAMGS
ncbi:MAG: prokaryotic E2 ligase family D protein [Chloroflexi bacterium]|nr:prokaryotic E2 ligase family D protein [Chloroflexota bacterium]